MRMVSITLSTLMLLAACGDKSSSPGVDQQAAANQKSSANASTDAPASPTVDRNVLALFGQLPAEIASPDNPITDEKITLGRMLYYDTRLSKDHDLSCNSCHLLDKFGVDNDKTSSGHRTQRGDRNSPTVYNAAGHVAQFWDGRATTIEEQAKGPVLNAVEMAMPDDASVVAVLNSIPGYVEAFAMAFAGEDPPVSYDNMAKAIGAFERKLVTPGRFDKYLGGDQSALSDEEKAGLIAFVNTGCPTCHSGAYVGGHMFQKLGLVKPWPNQDDPGRYAATKVESDRMFFKVPSLRNVAKTAPYFHDGSVDDLGKAVDMMAEHQLGRKLDPKDTTAIVAFLGALTGEVPTEYIAKPELPANGPNTPKPDPG